MSALPTTRPEVVAYIALGANLGDARAAVISAVDAIAQLPQTQLIASSSLYRTAPLESTGAQSAGADYINAVVQVSTCLPAYSLLQALQNLEQLAGRERPYRHAPRTLDLDLLFYGSAQIQSAQLTVPHPRWQTRAFVLWPLKEIATETVSDAMLAAVADQAIEKV